MNKSAVTIVIPCYNEFGRLAMDKFSAFVEKHPDICFLFVDDGSTDGTGDLIKGYCDHKTIQLLTLPQNSGKAEAVRRGIRKSLEQGVPRIGFWDADLATPLETICSFMEKMNQNGKLDMVIGSRVLRLGSRIKRNAVRHVISRILMTLVYSMVDFYVYDSQCGAKIMTAEAARGITDKPFVTKWFFDLEMLIRLQRIRQTDLSGNVYEFPLQEWSEIGCSKVRIITVIKDLWRFFYHYRWRGKE